MNKHEWVIGVGVSAGKCSNGPLPPNHDKAWQVEGSPAHKALIKVVLNVTFLKNVHHYMKFRFVIQHRILDFVKLLHHSNVYKCVSTISTKISLLIIQHICT